MAAFQQAQLQQQVNGGAAPAAAPGGMVNMVQQGRPAQAPQRVHYPGLDARGPSWHVHSAALGCRVFPCNIPFCQACAIHGHTAEECRKLQYNNPGVNKSGYWCEQKPGCAPIRAPKPQAVANVAVQAPVPAFPVPYVLNGQAAGAANAPAAQPHNQPQAQVNNASSQMPPAPARDAAGGNQ